jgi:peptide-methionine (S)-S-oxide reductase
VSFLKFGAASLGLAFVLSGCAPVAEALASQSGPDEKSTYGHGRTEKGLFKVSDAEAPAETELATLGAGCFWGIEEAFRKTPGVVATAVGYSGGDVVDPTYRQVLTGKTGHAEVVQVEFDPDALSYEDVLMVFWRHHNPTTLNRQGPDIGHQYRSAIFAHDDEQLEIAQESKRGVQPRFDDPIVTEITAYDELYFAEDYHQQYIAKGGRAFCPAPNW